MSPGVFTWGRELYDWTNFCLRDFCRAAGVWRMANSPLQEEYSRVRRLSELRVPYVSMDSNLECSQKCVIVQLNRRQHCETSWNPPIYQTTSVLECARLDLMFRRSSARTWWRLVCQCLLSRSARSLYIYKHAYVCFSGLCKCDIRVLPGDPARAYSSSWLRAKGQGMIRNESKWQFF